MREHMMTSALHDGFEEGHRLTRVAAQEQASPACVPDIVTCGVTATEPPADVDLLVRA